MIRFNEKLDSFSSYLDQIEDNVNKERMIKVLDFVIQKFPHLDRVIKWNQPMFTDHGTFIIGFSITKNHLNIAPERATMVEFTDLLQDKGIPFTKMLIQMKWEKPFDFELIEEIINYNIAEKKLINRFWR